MTFPKSKQIKVESCLKDSKLSHLRSSHASADVSYPQALHLLPQIGTLYCCLGLVCIMATLLRFLGKTTRNYTTGQAKLVHHIELGYDTKKLRYCAHGLACYYNPPGSSTSV